MHRKRSKNQTRTIADKRSGNSSIPAAIIYTHITGLDAYKFMERMRWHSQS